MPFCVSGADAQGTRGLQRMSFALRTHALVASCIWDCRRRSEKSCNFADKSHKSHNPRPYCDIRVPWRIASNLPVLVASSEPKPGLSAELLAEADLHQGDLALLGGRETANRSSCERVLDVILSRARRSRQVARGSLMAHTHGRNLSGATMAQRCGFVVSGLCDESS